MARSLPDDRTLLAGTVPNMLKELAQAIRNIDRSMEEHNRMNETAFKELTQAIRDLNGTIQENGRINETLFRDLTAQMTAMTRKLDATATQTALQTTAQEIRADMQADRELAQRRFDAIMALLKSPGGGPG